MIAARERARDRLASARAALALTRISLQEKLAYPHDMLSDLLQMLVEMLVFRQLWIALYGGQGAYAGVTLDQALTYQVVNVMVARLFSSWLFWDVNERLRSGDILFDVARPMYYGRVLLYQFTGGALTMLLTTTLPMSLLAWLLFDPLLPPSAAVWLAFLASLALGFLTAFYLDYLLALLGFWVTEMGGFLWAKESVILILGGTYLPLWIYPPALRRILAFLPFRGISYTPVALFVGAIPLEEALAAIGIQLAWVVILAWGSRRVYGAAMARLAVQGG